MTYVQQVGGDHYEYGDKLLNQHWDLMDRWDIEYLLATASKYVVRWDRKGFPLLDIGKSVSYLTKQLECRPTGARRVIPSMAVHQWFMDNRIHQDTPRESEKRLLIELIHIDGSADALHSAVATLNLMFQREQP